MLMSQMRIGLRCARRYCWRGVQVQQGRLSYYKDFIQPAFVRMAPRRALDRHSWPYATRQHPCVWPHAALCRVVLSPRYREVACDNHAISRLAVCEGRSTLVRMAPRRAMSCCLVSALSRSRLRQSRHITAFSTGRSVTIDGMLCGNGLTAF